MLEVVRRQEAASKTDQGVCRDGWDSSGTDERGERNGGREDSAEQESGHDEHDRDSVAGLLVLGDLRDPAGEGEDAVPCHGPDQPRACYAGDGGILGMTFSGLLYNQMFARDSPGRDRECRQCS